jgi:sortase (surface protein transpeptidase)
MEKSVIVAASPRARMLGWLAALVLLVSLLAPASFVAAQDDEETGGLPEVPTTGAARPGPIALDATPEAEEEEVEGVAPVGIQIEKIGVDAPIERVKIIDGVMQNPTGPWVVSWYDELPALGEGNNVVMAGHVDYYTVGPAVFYGFKDPGLVEGDRIRVTGEDGTVFEYAVQTSRLYNVATDLTPEVIEEEIVGETDEETLTLITCGGEFNYETGEYVSRMVVRATQL